MIKRLIERFGMLRLLFVVFGILGIIFIVLKTVLDVANVKENYTHIEFFLAYNFVDAYSALSLGIVGALAISSLGKPDR